MKVAFICALLALVSFVFVLGYYVVFDMEFYNVDSFSHNRNFDHPKIEHHSDHALKGVVVHRFFDTYTSAVCDGNVCQDHLFTCVGGEIVNSTVISGFVVFGGEWADLREDKDKC